MDDWKLNVTPVVKLNRPNKRFFFHFCLFHLLNELQSEEAFCGKVNFRQHSAMSSGLFGFQRRLSWLLVIYTSIQGCSGNFGFGGMLLEAWGPTPSPIPPWGSGRITPGKILKFQMPNPAIWCISYAASVNIIVPAITALVRVTHFVALTRTCKHRSNRVSAEKITILYVRLFAQSAVRQYSNQTIKLTTAKTRRKDRKVQIARCPYLL